MEVAKQNEAVDARSKMSPMCQKPLSKIFERLPILRDDEIQSAVVNGCLQLENVNLAANVTDIVVKQRVPKTGFFDPMSVPEFLFRMDGDGEGTAPRKTIVVSGPATMFDGFGPYVNEKTADGGKAHRRIETGKTKSLRVHEPGSTGEDMDLRVSTYLPFDADVLTESSKIIHRCCVRATIPGPANLFEAKRLHAAQEFASGKPNVLYPHVDFKLPSIDELLATAATDGYIKPPADAPDVYRRDTRVANHNTFPLCVPFVTKQTGVKVDASTDNIVRMKQQLREKYLRVVEALFTSMDGMTLSAGGLTSLLASAPAIVELMDIGLDVSRLAELFKSIDDKAAYKFAVPTTVFGPDSIALSVKELYDLTYNRSKDLTPYIATEMGYSAYRLDPTRPTTVFANFPRTTILGFVPAVPIKVIAKAEESCVPRNVAQAAVEAAFAKQNGGNTRPAIEAAPVMMAIDAPSANDDDDDAAAALAAEAAEAAEASASPRKRLRDPDDDGRKNKNKRQKTAA